MDEMKEKVLNILLDLHDDIDYEAEEKLIDNKLLDSFDIVTLISELSDEFDIEIPPQEIVESNFNSLEKICNMVNRLS